MRGLAVLLMLLPLTAVADELVAARTIKAGSIIQLADIAATPTDDGGPIAADMVGKQARVTIYQGRSILASALGAPMLVSRNQLVKLAYATPTLRIETDGRALGQGGVGDVIRVMNLSSHATISARINPDGTLTVNQP